MEYEEPAELEEVAGCDDTLTDITVDVVRLDGAAVLFNAFVVEPELEDDAELSDDVERLAIEEVLVDVIALEEPMLLTVRVDADVEATDEVRLAREVTEITVDAFVLDALELDDVKAVAELEILLELVAVEDIEEELDEIALHIGTTVLA